MRTGQKVRTRGTSGGSEALAARGEFGSRAYTAPGLTVIEFTGTPGVIYDNGGFFDIANSQLVIPASGIYIYTIGVTTTSNNQGYLAAIPIGSTGVQERQSFAAQTYQYAILTGGPRAFIAGDVIYFMIQAASSGDFALRHIAIAKIADWTPPT